MVEVIFTLMLCVTVTNCASSTRNNPDDDNNQFFALAIGFVIIAGGHAAGDVSGAAFNPAVSLALDVTSLDDGIYWGPWYSFFQLIGAFLAAIAFRILRSEEFSSSEEEGTTVPPLAAQVLSEFLGTFFFVFTVCLNIVMQSSATAVSAGATRICMASSLADVSGGYFNPAVTLAVVASARRKCDPVKGLIYCFAQLAAGLCAGMLGYHFLFSGPNHGEMFALGPTEGYTWKGVAFAEGLFTFVLAFIVLAVATSEPPESPTEQNFQFGIAIGSCTTLGGLAIGAVSMGALNPAVSFGVALGTRIVHGLYVPPPFYYCLLYSAFQMIGGVAAAVVFRLTHAQEYKHTIPQ